MNLDPQLNSLDRVGSLLLGLGLVLYAWLGDFERDWSPPVLAVLGLVFVVGGIGGT